MTAVVIQTNNNPKGKWIIPENAKLFVNGNTQALDWGNEAFKLGWKINLIMFHEHFILQDF